MATSKSRTVPRAEVTELAQKVREHFATNLRQGQRLAVDGTKTWLEAVKVITRPELSKIPALPGFSELAALTTFPLDVAADVLDEQRRFVMQLTGVRVPAKSA